MVAPHVKRRRRAELKKAEESRLAEIARVAEEDIVEEVVEEVAEEAALDLGSLRKWELIELAEAAGHDVLGFTKRQLVELLS